MLICQFSNCSQSNPSISYEQIYSSERLTTLNHHCQSINEARTKEIYLKQEDNLNYLRRTLCLTNIAICITQCPQDSEKFTIQCKGKPLSSENKNQQYYEHKFNQFILDIFQTINYKVICQVSDLNAIEEYNNENLDVYINQSRDGLCISLFLFRNLEIHQLFDQIKAHRNRINDFFQINCENIENIKSFTNQYQLNYDLKVNLDKQIYTNVFNYRLTQIGQNSITLLKLFTRIELQIICEPSQLQVLQSNIQEDFIDLLQIETFKANLQELLLFLQISLEEFQMVYEVVVLTKNDEFFKLFGISSSFKQIENFIQSIKIQNYNMTFDNPLIFEQLRQQYLQDSFIQFPAKLEFLNNQCKIQCKRQYLGDCLVVIQTKVKEIQSKILRINSNLDSSVLQFLKQKPYFFSNIQQSTKCQLKFQQTYQIIYGIGQPLNMKKEKYTIQFINNGIFNLEYDALIGLGQQDVIDEIMSYFPSSDKTSLLLEIPKNIFLFSYLLILNEENVKNLSLFQWFIQLELKRVAILAKDENLLISLIDFLLFSSNKSFINTVFIIEEDIERLTDFQRCLQKNQNFSQSSTWEVKNVYEYVKIYEDLNNHINIAYNDFISTKQEQTTQFGRFSINFTHQSMSLITNLNVTQNLRRRQLLHTEQMFLEGFIQSDLDELKDKLNIKINEIMNQNISNQIQKQPQNQIRRINLKNRIKSSANFQETPEEFECPKDNYLEGRKVYTAKRYQVQQQKQQSSYSTLQPNDLSNKVVRNLKKNQKENKQNKKTNK